MQQSVTHNQSSSNQHKNKTNTDIQKITHKVRQKIWFHVGEKKLNQKTKLTKAICDNC